jgi:hypothetical protein
MTAAREHVRTKLSWLDVVMDHPQTAGADIAVATVIARATRAEHGDAAVDQSYIAAKAKIGKRTVVRVLAFSPSKRAMAATPTTAIGWCSQSAPMRRPASLSKCQMCILKVPPWHARIPVTFPVTVLRGLLAQAP